jgi:hypothetical protein
VTGCVTKKRFFGATGQVTDSQAKKIFAPNSFGGGFGVAGIPCGRRERRFLVNYSPKGFEGLKTLGNQGLQRADKMA